MIFWMPFVPEWILQQKTKMRKEHMFASSIGINLKNDIKKNNKEGRKMIKGYKVFNPDWTCAGIGRNGYYCKKYSCPGKFEEEGEPKVCIHGMHFCEKLADCFNHYTFNSDNKVAEVIAYGKVVKDEGISCTDELEIIREIPWDEVLRIVNIGRNCTGWDILIL